MFISGNILRAWLLFGSFCAVFSFPTDTPPSEIDVSLQSENVSPLEKTDTTGSDLKDASCDGRCDEVGEGLLEEDEDPEQDESLGPENLPSTEATDLMEMVEPSIVVDEVKDENSKEVLIAIPELTKDSIENECDDEQEEYADEEPDPKKIQHESNAAKDNPQEGSSTPVSFNVYTGAQILRLPVDDSQLWVLERLLLQEGLEKWRKYIDILVPEKNLRAFKAQLENNKLEFCVVVSDIDHFVRNNMQNQTAGHTGTNGHIAQYIKPFVKNNLSLYSCEKPDPKDQEE